MIFDHFTAEELDDLITFCLKTYGLDKDFTIYNVSNDRYGNNAEAKRIEFMFDEIIGFRNGLLLHDTIDFGNHIRSSYLCGQGLRKFLNQGGFGKIEIKERRKKLWVDIKTWLPVGVAFAAVIIAACSWLFPRTDNVIIQRLQNQINELKKENSTIRKELNNSNNTDSTIHYHGDRPPVKPRNA